MFYNVLRYYTFKINALPIDHFIGSDCEAGASVFEIAIYCSGKKGDFEIPLFTIHVKSGHNFMLRSGFARYRYTHVKLLVINCFIKKLSACSRTANLKRY